MKRVKEQKEEVNTNKVVAYFLIASISLSFLIEVLSLNEEFYTLAGLGILVFGIWSSVILLKK